MKDYFVSQFYITRDDLITRKVGLFTSIGCPDSGGRGSNYRATGDSVLVRVSLSRRRYNSAFVAGFSDLEYFVFFSSMTMSCFPLDFRQVGYDEQSKFYGSNNFAWGQVLQNLTRVVESRNLT